MRVDWSQCLKQIELANKRYDMNLPLTHDFYRHFAEKYGWSFWFNYGDELV